MALKIDTLQCSVWLAALRDASCRGAAGQGRLGSPDDPSSRAEFSERLGMCGSQV
jgi:hypothetical protein